VSSSTPSSARDSGGQRKQLTLQYPLVSGLDSRTFWATPERGRILAADGEATKGDEAKVLRGRARRRIETREEGRCRGDSMVA
jgi:hypothetical protein